MWIAFVYTPILGKRKINPDDYGFNKIELLTNDLNEATRMLHSEIKERDDGVIAICDAQLAKAIEEPLRQAFEQWLGRLSPSSKQFPEDWRKKVIEQALAHGFKIRRAPSRKSK